MAGGEGDDGDGAAGLLLVGGEVGEEVAHVGEGLVAVFAFEFGGVVFAGGAAAALDEGSGGCAEVVAPVGVGGRAAGGGDDDQAGAFVEVEEQCAAGQAAVAACSW